MAWEPHVLRDDNGKHIHVILRNGGRERKFDVVAVGDDEALTWAQERAWMEADRLNEQDE